MNKNIVIGKEKDKATFTKRKTRGLKTVSFAIGQEVMRLNLKKLGGRKAD